MDRRKNTLWFGDFLQESLENFFSQSWESGFLKEAFLKRTPSRTWSVIAINYHNSVLMGECQTYIVVTGGFEDI